MDIKNKVIIITGSASNIGRATALLFAKEGAKIVVNSKNNIEGGKKTVEDIKKLGAEAIYIQADVSNQTDVDNLFSQTLKNFGTVDILINNAGSSVGKPFLETDKKYWIDVFNDNFFGTVLCSQKAAQIMKEKGSGKILNTSSIRGIEHTGREAIIAYSAAKAAVISFTKTLAKELAPHIQVNAIAPGFVITPNYDKTPQAMKEEFIKGTMINRWIQVEEIAQAFYFLAQMDAITGQVLVVDGGFTLKRG